MSCTIYLVRHAIAEDHSESGRDADRRLTTSGAAKMHRACAGLSRLGVAPELVYTSPLVRTRQTAEILCQALGLGVTPKVLSALAPGGYRQVPAALRVSGDVGSIALVGHAPDMGELAALLIGCGPGDGNIAFKKGSVAAIEVEGLPPATPGVLAWLIAPRQLRALGGGDD
jgi:phosphohistidine phosphatase